MKSLKDQLRDLEVLEKELKEKRRSIYRESLGAPKEDKVCDDYLAEVLSEKEQFPVMEFPLDIMGVNWVEAEEFKWKCQLVAVRPVSEDKTYLGIYVGELPLGASVSYHLDSGVLHIRLDHYNPAIVIPELGRIVMGAESWWKRIKTEDQLRDITDDSIQNVWYVKMLTKMFRNEVEEKEKEDENNH